MNNKSLVMIISNLGMGGAEVSLYNLCRSIKSDFKIDVITLLSNGELEAKFRDEGINVYSVNMDGAFSILPGFYRLLILLKSLKPNVIHTWMYHADFFGGLAAKIIGIKYVIWGIHNFNIEKGMLKNSTRFIVFLCGIFSWMIPTKIITCSKAAINPHKKFLYNTRKFVVIPNGIDINKFKISKDAKSNFIKSNSLNSNIKIIGLIGRFDPQKNLQGFIRLAEYVSSIRQDALFIIAGKGNDKKNKILSHEIKAAGLEDKILLLGQVNEIQELIAALDILVLTSHGEAFPLVLLEALACGVKCFSTNVGDVVEILGGFGGIVPRGKMKQMSEMILDYLSELDKVGYKNIKLEKANYRGRVKNNFSLEIFAKLHIKIYENIIS
jgi:glycosyltransferase involved in cell wall biosynthesis